MSAFRFLSPQRWLHWAFAVAIVLSSVSDSRADAIAWQQDFEQARQLAAQQNKLVLVHVWAPWCGPCRRMDREVFNQPDLAAAIHALYVPVKINTDQLPAARHAFGIRAWPTDIVMTPDGKVIKKMEGFRTASQYGALMAQIAGAARPNIPQLVTRPVAPPVQRQPLAPPVQRQTVAPPVQRQQTVPSAEPALAPQRAVDNPSEQRQPSPRRPIQQGSAPSEDVAPAPAPRFTERPTPREPAAASPQNRDQRYRNFRPEDPDYRQEPARQRQPVASRQPIDSPPSQPSRANPPPHADPREQPPLPRENITSNRRPPVEPRLARRGTDPGLPTRNNNRQEPTAPEPPPVARNPNLPDLGLEGYCPVRLMQDKTWVRGNPEWGVIHRGRLYLFSGPREKSLFFADPDRYAPVASGADPVIATEEGRRVEGKRELGVFGKDGRIYLFAREETLRVFESNPEKYAAEIVEPRLYKR